MKCRRSVAMLQFPIPAPGRIIATRCRLHISEPIFSKRGVSNKAFERQLSHRTTMRWWGRPSALRLSTAEWLPGLCFSHFRNLTIFDTKIKCLCPFGRFRRSYSSASGRYPCLYCRHRHIDLDQSGRDLNTSLSSAGGVGDARRLANIRSENSVIEIRLEDRSSSLMAPEMLWYNIWIRILNSFFSSNPHFPTE